MSLDDDKKREEIAKLKVERLKTLTGLCVSVCSALGIVGVFAYCFFIAGFVPAGLSMGDTLFFVFAMLAFTFTGVVLALLGMLPFVPYVMQSRAAGSWPLTKFVRGDNAIWALAPVVGLAVIASFKLLASVKSVNTDYVFSVEWAIAAFILLGVYLAIVQLLMDDWVGALGYSVPGLIFILFSSVAASLATSAGSGVGAVRALASLGIILLAGVTFAVAFSMLGASGTTSPAPAAKYKSVLALILFGSFLPYLAAATSLGSFNFVMQGLGLREESATLIVNAATWRRFREQPTPKVRFCTAAGSTKTATR